MPHLYPDRFPLSALRSDFRIRMREYRGMEHRLTVAMRKGLLKGVVAQLRYLAQWPQPNLDAMSASELRAHAIDLSVAAQDATLGGRYKQAKDLDRDSDHVRQLAADREASRTLAVAA